MNRDIVKRSPDDEFLLQRYVDGLSTAAEIERLNQRLRSDARAREQLIELLNLDSALAAADWGAWNVAAPKSLSENRRGLAHFAMPWEQNVPVPLSADGSRIDSKADALQKLERNRSGVGVSRRWLLAAAASVALVASGTWFWPASQAGFATVPAGAGVDDLADGRNLAGELQEIKAGAVELVTAHGARVVIEAPAKFRFESAQRLHLMHGRLAADVPPSAKGFTVVTPTGQAVDLGTKFGVDAPLAGESEIHVFEGEVIAQLSDGRARHSMRDGEALRWQSGVETARKLRSSAFIRPAEVASLHAALAAGQRARSEAALAALRGDPALIALLDFESNDLPAGAYRMTQGRWPGSRAPEFVEVGDHMRLNVGGDRQWPQLTLAAWVRLDRIGEPYQSLLHTDGWNQNRLGQVHWMVTRHTTMRLALFGNTLASGSDERDGYPDSRTSVLPEQGRWAHLATVYDSEQRRVRFYLNGEFDKETRQQISHPARLGPCQIGNWDRQDRKLSGRIDELLILGRALDDSEARALFAAGNPYHE